MRYCTYFLRSPQMAQNNGWAAEDKLRLPLSAICEVLISGKHDPQQQILNLAGVCVHFFSLSSEHDAN